MMQGGTKVILIDRTSNRRTIATDDDNKVVSERLLQNIESVSEGSSSSTCSMVLKCDLISKSDIKLQRQDMNDRLTHNPNPSEESLFNTVCMKITLITRIKPVGHDILIIPWQEKGSSLESCAGQPWRMMMKGSTTFSQQPGVRLHVESNHVVISGATDALIGHMLVNGVYDRTGELSGGWPLFRKRGDGDTDMWIHYWPATNTWIVTNTESKGKDDAGWAIIACRDKTIMKVVSDEKECETEFQAQRSMYSQLLCGENPRELIPDALASIVMTHEEFNHYMHSRRYSEQSLRIVNWISKSAVDNNLLIHITFMDFLEDYKSLYEFNSDQTISDEIYWNAVLDAGYVLVMIVLMTKGLPWDLHRNNILIDSKTHKAKCIDFGRMQFLNIDPQFQHLKKCLTTFLKDYPQHCSNFFKVGKIDEIKSKFVVLINNVVKYSNEKYEFHSLNENEQFKRVYEILVLVAFSDIITGYFHYDVLRLKCSHLLMKLFNFPDVMSIEAFLTNFPSTYEELPSTLKAKLDFKYIATSITESIGLCKNPNLRLAASFRPPTKAQAAEAAAKAAAEAAEAAQAAAEAMKPPHSTDFKEFYDSLYLRFYPLDGTKLTAPVPTHSTEDDDDAIDPDTTFFDKNVDIAVSRTTHFMIGTRTDPEFTFGHILRYRRTKNKFEYYDEKTSGYKYKYIDVSNPAVYVASENNSLADTSTKQYLRMSLQAIEGFLYLEVDEYGRVRDTTKHGDTDNMLASGYPRESSFDRIFYLLIKHRSSPENLKKCTDVCEHIVKNSSRCDDMMKRALKVSEGGSRKRIRKYFKKSKSKFNRKSKSKTKRQQKK